MTTPSQPDMPEDSQAKPEQLLENDSPIINIISDSIGDSAATMAIAAASQFSDGKCLINRLPKVNSIEQMRPFIEQHLQDTSGEMILFHTIADEQLRAELDDYLRDKNVAAVDLIGPAIDAIALATGRTPRGEPGLIRETDEAYFIRVEAMEFAVEHDDGRNPESLADADIVLIGVSRTSKTPLSIYLATLGYKVANVPLALGSEPPTQLFELDRRRVFGLSTDAALLSSIRHRRLGNAAEIAATYASLNSVLDDLDQARMVMRKIGCIVIHTDNRAIEETAQVILRYYEASFK
ncbi:MAG: kinase/pyrophosphorylase [Coriobacteriales bacterium]|nr:kinase/pyrophosphorylase [Coriobacteriales bacterium]